MGWRCLGRAALGFVHLLSEGGLRERDGWMGTGVLWSEPWTVNHYFHYTIIIDREK